MKSLKFFFYYFLFSVSVFSQPATKQDIQLLIQQMDKRFEQVDKRFEQMQKQMDRRFEQMDKRFEQVDKQIEYFREDMNKRFDQMDKRFEFLTNIVYWILGALSTFIVPLYYLMWKQYRKPNIYQIEQQIYQSEPEIKARVYLHLKKQAEEYKTSISS